MLGDMDAMHYARYKMSWPPENTPEDVVVSRIACEIGRRQFSVRHVMQ